jgi:signal transduction histidine kinase
MGEHAASRQPLLWLRAVAVLAVAAPAVIFAAVAAYLYQEEFSGARLRLDRAAHIAQEHALKLFDTNEMLLQRMLDLVGSSDDAQLRSRGEELHHRLKQMAGELPQVQGLFINGADGRAIANSLLYPPAREIDYSDREWFIAHRGGGRGIFFTGQLVSRVTGEPFFDMSRRRSAADGSFAGVVNVSLRPRYLTRFYEELGARNAGLRLAVLRDDGSLIAISPGRVEPGGRASADAPIMRAIANGGTEGQVDGPSALDNLERLKAWRRLGEYPLYVVASIDRADVLAAWGKRIGLLALFALPTALGFAWMAWVALRRTAQALAASSALRDEAEQRARMEQALLQSQKLEALGRLTGGVAHDFNNLLMVMLSNIYLLKRNPENREPVAVISRAVDAGTKLTRQLLAFSSRQGAHPEVMRLQDELPALADLIRPILGSSVALSFSADERTAPVKLDRPQLELAILNLAVNARDAMPAGGSLKLEVRNEGDHVALLVADSGVGMPDQVRARAFEPFFTTKSAGRGTGLGLSQVYGFCRQAGGSASIETREGEGTVVRLLFPASQELPQGAAARASNPLLAVRAHVLLVEDNQDVAESCLVVLRELGCSAQRCESAESALDALARQARQIDLVLSDIVMPGGKSGIELAREVRARYPGIGVVLMTGYAKDLEQTRPEATVLQKPFTPRELAAAIDGATATRAAARAAARSRPEDRMAS